MLKKHNKPVWLEEMGGERNKVREKENKGSDNTERIRERQINFLKNLIIILKQG